SKSVPAWSPDGREILVQTYYNRNVPIVVDVIQADGSGQRRLADDASFYGTPSWSPDGMHILYEAQFGIGAALYMMVSDGQHRRLLLQNSADPNAAFHASWQPRT